MLKRLLPVLLVGLLLVAGNAAALEVAGVQLAHAVSLGGESLQLNGYGIRKKFFFKIYVGSLYTTRLATSTWAVLGQG